MTPATHFEKKYRVFGAPSRYVQGRGALGQLGRLTANLGNRAVIVADQLVFDLIESQLRDTLDAYEIPLCLLTFSGELLPDTAQRLLESYAAEPGDVIVACGGGRAIDTGKALAELAKTPLITVPTVASTDAPTSKNYVTYDNDHQLLEVRHLVRNPDAVVVDTRVLAAAPKHMFAAGLGDALAKFFEAESVKAAGGVNMFDATPTRLALAVAKCCYETLLTVGDAALDAAGTGNVTEDFEDAVEAMILMAGLGFENGGLSVAHALTRGLSLLPGAKEAPHGYQVAYGLYVQLALSEQCASRALTRLVDKASLPRSLSALCKREVTADEVRLVAEATVDVRHMRNFPAAVSARDLVEAMQQVESADKPLEDAQR